MKIVIIGSGYVGLVTGACLADFGHEVTCVDTDAAKIEGLRAGRMPIHEPGLGELVTASAGAGRLSFTTELGAAVAQAEVVFLAVGTPSRRGDGHADLTYVHDAARELAPHLSGFTVVATKSTVPVGTGDEVARIVGEVNPGADVTVVSNPEFLREGAAIEDFRHPDRIVVGIEDERARAVMIDVYRPLYLNRAPVMFTTRRTAELIKYASNAFLAMKITFINEVANLCEVAEADVQEVARGLGLDQRIGSKFLNAGPGFGGSCFPKDTQALIRMGQELGAPLRLVETTVAVNAERRRRMGERVVAACGGDVRGKKIAVLGLTFKPNTDDLREAPALDIVRFLLEAGADVHVFDPEGMAAARAVVPAATFGAGPYEVAEAAEALVLVTEWNQFRSLDLKRLKQTMARPVFIDLRNVYRRQDMAEHGFSYHDIGRGLPDR